MTNLSRTYKQKFEEFEPNEHYQNIATKTLIDRNNSCSKYNTRSGY